MSRHVYILLTFSYDYVQDLKNSLGLSSVTQTTPNKKSGHFNNEMTPDSKETKRNWYDKREDTDQKKGKNFDSYLSAAELITPGLVVTLVDCVSGDYEVSISERIAKRKRNSRIPDTPVKGMCAYRAVFFGFDQALF